jgi:exopolyphosphatase/guanosine-5'-triphosphate,3'-diphosphate pyrophosphatase
MVKDRFNAFFQSTRSKTRASESVHACAQPTGLDQKSKAAIVILSTFLRLAEKLDRSHCSLVRKAEFTNAGKDMIMLSFYSDSDCSLEKWSIIQNRQAFDEAFGKQLDVHCVVTPTS